MRRRIVLATLSIILIASIVVRSQVFTISFGLPAVTTLSTTSTGAVTGNTFALPGGNASVVSWQSTANGSALSTTLQASIDNSSWTTIATCVVAAGCLSSTGVIGYPFIRTNQVSRTGGTLTTNTIVAVRAYSAAAIGATATLQGNLLFTPDNTWTIGASGVASRPATIWATTINAGTGGMSSTGAILGLSDLRAGATGGFYWNTRNIITSPSNGVVQMTDNAGTGVVRLNLGPGTASFAAVESVGATLRARLADGSGNASMAVLNVQFSPTLFGALPAANNGTSLYCSDCLANSNPCSGASTGAMAKRLNAAWDCR